MRSAHLVASLALALAGCGDGGNPTQSDGGLTFSFSNGITPLHGVDPAQVTTLSGGCGVTPETGEIQCGNEIIRLNTPGIWQGIGWQLVDAHQSNCAGTSMSAPKIGVFTFGSLAIAPGSLITSQSNTSFAFVAAKTIDVQGAIRVWGPPPEFYAESR